MGNNASVPNPFDNCTNTLLNETLLQMATATDEAELNKYYNQVLDYLDILKRTDFEQFAKYRENTPAALAAAAAAAPANLCE